MNDPRRLAGPELLAAFGEARRATLEATVDLDDEQWRVPYHRGIQPTAWDLAHVGWFAEFWLLRGPHRIDVDGNVTADRPQHFIGPDDRYDSARIGHRARWEMPLFPRAELLERLQAQLAACVAEVERLPDDDRSLYQGRFAVYHERMHGEALLWTRALLGHAVPPGVVMRTPPPTGEVVLPGGRFPIGRQPGSAGFAFDNELPGRHVELRPFRIDSSPVTNGRFLEFVAAGGYARPELWPGPAGVWLARQARRMPERWRRGAGDRLEHRWFDRWTPLPLAEPVVHVNAFEAEAFCRFAGRRLPRAAEWEVAATQTTWGHMVWEWTADAFAPYSGFRPAPYTTYSAPWFHAQRELRGGAFATDALLHDATYRNFFLPQRTDVFAGFRTAADA